MQAGLAGAAVVATMALLGLLGLHREVLRRVLLGTVDPRPLALFRIAFGLSLLGLVIETAPLSTYLFSDEGLLPSAAVSLVYGGPARDDGDLLQYLASGNWSLLHFRDDPSFVHLHVAALVVACVGLVIGCYTRTCAVLAWFLLASLLRRGDAHWGGEQSFTGLSFVLMFARSGAAYSVDAWRRSRALARRGQLDLREGAQGGRGAPPDATHPQGLAAIYPRVPAWPQALMIAQLALAYAVNGWTKSGPTWVTGDTLGLAVHMDRYARADWHGLAVALGPWPFRLATWSVLWWERLFPLLLVGLWLRAAERSRVPPLHGPARLGARACWLVLASALIVWAVVPGALAEDPGPVASARAWSLGVGAIVVAAIVVLGPRLRGLTRARGLLAPRLWLGFGLLFHIVSLVLFELGSFVSATVSAYVLCGIGPWCVAGVQRITRALARAGIPVPAHLRRETPLLAEAPSLLHLHHDTAALPSWAWWSAGSLVLLGGVLALATETPVWHGSWLLAAGGLVAVGWRSARRAPAPTPPLSSPWAYGPAGRLAAGGLLAYHLAALVLWQTPHWPSTPWRDDARGMVNPWMELSFTRQLWSMFAPNGPRRNQTVRTTIVDQAGVVHDLRTELEHPENLRRPYLRHDRWRKVDEAMSGYRAKLAPWHARYVCRHWALEHEGEPPTEVVLERVVAPFPPLRPVDAQAFFWKRAKVAPIVRARCADEPYGLLDATVRARHGLPAAPSDPSVPSPVERRRAPDPLSPLWPGLALVLLGVLAVWAREDRAQRR